ncbi:hypothetical protein ACNS7O_07065 [Haloferacaceae archaeon DSL9]
MAESSAALLFELAETGFFALGTGALSTIGLYIEQLAMQTLGAGDMQLGIWLAVVGAVALYMGVYAMGVTELLPRLRALTGRGDASR